MMDVERAVITAGVGYRPPLLHSRRGEEGPKGVQHPLSGRCRSPGSRSGPILTLTLTLTLILIDPDPAVTCHTTR
jgi:hypothetical protein